MILFKKTTTKTLKDISIATIKRIFLYGLFFSCFVLGIITYVISQIYFGDVSALKITSILTKLEEETSIYYDDQTTVFGSIFNDRHRKYTPIIEIPAHVQNAIIAAEDKNFYTHHGIDFIAISYAFLDGIKNKGRFRRGGSTLTQQTVKNIMQDWEASFSRKFREMIKAFQLERIYTKKQILEFYLNQFHVAGNGSGIGIASQYYFNKDVKDLNLIEAAFIAGSVKSPSRYNPFIKKDKTSYQNAIKKGFKRKNYVLQRMKSRGWVQDQEYQIALNQNVPFNKGKFTTSDVTLVRLIKKQVSKKEVLDAIGISHPSLLRTSGLKIYTTINKDLQTIAQRVTRRNLARLETILSGFKTQDNSLYKDLRLIEKGTFAFGKVTAINGSNVKDYSIELSFGLPTATIPNQSLQRYAKLLFMANYHKEGYRPYIKQMIDQINVGDVLFVEIKDIDQKNLHATAELYRYPEISGGLIVLDKGNVKAVVSGFDTLGFHRAIQAKRQPGSIFKIPTLLAALQLGWTILDRIGNHRKIFSYQGQHYFPRPDHKITSYHPTIVWSGIMSENLAFVNLAFSLLKKLDFSQFKQLLKRLELSPKKNESTANYHYRVTKKIGVQLDNKGLKKWQLYNASKELEPDLIIEGKNQLSKNLLQLWWGDGFWPLIQSLFRANRQDYSLQEIKLRMRLARNNFLRYQRLKQFFEIDYSLLASAVNEYGYENIVYKKQFVDILARFSVINRYNQANKSKEKIIAYHMVFPEEEYQDVDDEPYLEERRLEKIQDLKKQKIDVDEQTFVDDEDYKWPVTEFDSLPNHIKDQAKPLSIDDIKSLWDYDLSDNDNNDNLYFYSSDQIYLDGIMPKYILDQLNDAVTSKVSQIKSQKDNYSLNMYYQHHDFRIGLGLYYIKELCKIMGVQSKIDPVLSISLGTNVLSVAEIAKLFQTFSQGKTYKFYDSDKNSNQLNYIKRIENRAGEILYQSNSKTIQVIDELVVYQLLEVLRKIITHGTGRRANGELYVSVDPKINVDPNKTGQSRIRIPAYGKTGTTDDFTTSYFAGFVPYPSDYGKPLDLDHIYTMATYVGYDVPKKMSSGRVNIYGSSGALPLWTDFFKEIIEKFDFSSYVDAFDLDMLDKKEWSANPDKRYWQRLRVDLQRGIVLGKINEKYVEDYSSTDLAETGEEFEDHYKIGKSIKGSMKVPRPYTESEPIPRSFSPFTDQTLKKVLQDYE